VLYSFQGLPDGATPAGGVVFDQAGSLYGATTDGGANNCPGITECGTVYQLRPPMQKGKPWTESILYVFQGVNSNDGETPAGGVLFDQAGNLYGTTAYGGSGGCKLFGGRVGCGTVYEMVPPKQKGGAWTESVIYSFQGGKDGYLPQGDMTFDTKGNLYGATQYGGGFGSCNAPYYQYCGTVFELSPPKTKGGKWTEKVLYSFKNGKDGANPNGGLIFDSKGVIYGTTFAGGGTSNCQGGGFVGCGTAFKLAPPIMKSGAWTDEVIHQFKGGTKDTNTPAAGLIWATGGSLYGTTVGGQNSGGDDGVIFRLTAAKPGRPWQESILHKFCGAQDGCAPTAALVFNQAGSLYGVAPVGTKFAGMVFRLRNIGPFKSWQYNTLYNFRGVPDGFGPGAALVLDELGNLYGTTLQGGVGQACGSGCGTVFEVSP
jgi:uncharacterized repeat protein (TIGR03803 family)